VSPEVNEMFEKIVGQPCMRTEVGSMRSISLGFGEEAKDPNRRRKRHYRLWEIGTYSGDWRIMNGVSVVLAKSFSSDIGELDAKLTLLHLGLFASVQQLSESAIRVNLDNGLAVEFFGNTDDDDEYFHVFCPESVYIEFSQKGWQVGRSDVPWTD
jgi:hypothetical protein